MIRSRTAQLIFQSFYCALGLVAVAGSLGLFEAEYRPTFYVYFTNLSNYLCIGVVLAELIQTARKRQDSPVTTAPQLKFMGLLAILCTFIVFNTLLAGAEGRNPALNYRVASLLTHGVLPVLYLLDWLLFYRRGRLKLRAVPLAMLFPVLYFGFLLLRAAALDFDPAAADIWPYFFLNPAKLGFELVATRLLIILGLYFAGALAFFGLDRLLKMRR